MRPYSEYHGCTKCGASSRCVGTKYATLITGREVIRRTCARCGYVWDELPCDSALARVEKSE